MTNFEEDPVFPCAERCPYRIGEQVDEAIVTEYLGIIVVQSAVVDSKLRAYQTRECTGATEWDEHGTFCPATNQAYNDIDEPGVRINDMAREFELLKRHHRSLWEMTLREAQEHGTGSGAERYAEVQFRFRVHQLSNKPWF